MIEYQDPSAPVYHSLNDIRARKNALQKDIRINDHEIKTLWNDLFHAPAEPASSTPSKRFSNIMTTGAGLMDGIILGWKLYRKFKK